MSNQELAARIIELIGGNSNISRAAHCMTRLRLNLYNNDLIQLKEIESLKGVLGAQMQNQQLQIIIGPQVGSLYNEIAAQANLNPAADAPKTNQKLFTRFLDILSGIFLPVIPAIAGAGMLKAIIALLKAANLVQVDSYTFQLFNMMADCIFYFLPFFLALVQSYPRRSSISIVLLSRRPFVRAILIGFIFLPPSERFQPAHSGPPYQFFLVKQTVISSPTRCTFGIPLIFA